MHDQMSGNHRSNPNAITIIRTMIVDKPSDIKRSNNL
jgi:hypothetical protein